MYYGENQHQVPKYRVLRNYRRTKCSGSGLTSWGSRTSWAPSPGWCICVPSASTSKSRRIGRCWDAAELSASPPPRWSADARPCSDGESVTTRTHEHFQSFAHPGIQRSDRQWGGSDAASLWRTLSPRTLTDLLTGQHTLLTSLQSMMGNQHQTHTRRLYDAFLWCIFSFSGSHTQELWHQSNH